jgi:hypothetical protein
MWNEDFSSLKILPTKCCLRLFFYSFTINLRQINILFWRIFLNEILILNMSKYHIKTNFPTSNYDLIMRLLTIYYIFLPLRIDFSTFNETGN